MTRLRLALAAAVALTVALMFPLSLEATEVLCPLPGAVTEESYTWDFSNEVTESLNMNEHDAVQLRLAANHLMMLARAPEHYSPEAHALALLNAKHYANRISDRMCRLMKVRRVAYPWQQAAIDDVRANLHEVVTNAENAMRLFEQRRSLTDLYAAEYQNSLKSLYNGAKMLCRCAEPRPEVSD